MAHRLGDTHSSACTTIEAPDADSPLEMILAVATGVAISQTVMVITTPVARPHRDEIQTVDDVRAFYDAANAVILTG